MICSRENIVGSPEKPLSDLGYMSFNPYWQQRIIDFLVNFSEQSVSIADIAKYTLFTAVDIVDTLYSKGILLVRNAGQEVVIYLRPEFVDEFYQKL